MTSRDRTGTTARTSRRKATVLAARAAVWLESNREALNSSNAWVKGRGLPLAGKRLF